MDNTVTLHINTPQPGHLTVSLRDAAGRTIVSEECPYQGPVDNLLLTAIDKLVARSSVGRFALKSVKLGMGIDKNSSLYRIVQSLAAAIEAVR